MRVVISELVSVFITVAKILKQNEKGGFLLVYNFRGFSIMGGKTGREDQLTLCVKEAGGGWQCRQG